MNNSSTPSAPLKGLAGWALFDWAAQPFYTLILTFIFAPYFATAVIGDAVAGQAMWGYMAAIAGLIVAIAGPVLGAIADATGPRKPWIAAFSAALIASLCLLWFAVPGGGGRLFLIAAAFIVASVSAECATIFTNAIMPQLVPPHRLGRLSGAGWALGYVGGLASLFLMLGFVVTDPASHKTLLGIDPVVALDEAMREGDRLAGPVSALWYALFVIPLFLYTPDRATGRVTGGSLTQGLGNLLRTIKDIAHLPPVAVFLLARMAYADGLAAIFVFGGIYGAGLFGWRSFELGLFGILLTLMGALGAVIGGVADDRIGAKRVIMGALLGLLVAVAGIVSIDQTHVLFAVEVPVKAAESAAFSSVGERFYLGFAMLIGLLAGPLQAASRSLLARLAPADKMTQFFGLFAFSGKITAFLAPLLIAVTTAIAASQRAGVAVILAFLGVGLVLMARVRAPPGRH